MTRRGDIVILDVPYSDGTGSKVRPALVIQANAYNQKLAQTIIAIITSSQRRLVGAKTQVILDISTPQRLCKILVSLYPLRRTKDGTQIRLNRAMQSSGDNQRGLDPSQDWRTLDSVD